MNDFPLLPVDWQTRLHKKRVVVGFDGFIDMLARPVRRGCIGCSPDYFHTLDEFGRFISERGGRSASVELDPMTERIGGNAPNTAAGLMALGVDTRLVGALGYPSLHPLFKEAFCSESVLTIANPGQSLSYEFDDGKLMCALNRDVNVLDWNVLRDRVGVQPLQNFYDGCSLAAFVNWSELAHAQQLWEGVLEHVFEKNGFPEWMFFDLSDCARKTSDELRRVARTMRVCGRKSKVVLSLNENEKSALGKALLDTESFTGDALLSILDGYAVVFHHLMDTHAFGEGISCSFQNHVVQNPRISTGGGDNFNAGLCAGLLGGLSLAQAAMLGSLCGSYYVEHGRCASAGTLDQYAQRHRMQ